MPREPGYQGLALAELLAWRGRQHHYPRRAVAMRPGSFPAAIGGCSSCLRSMQPMMVAIQSKFVLKIVDGAA
jgi:hypothetical protein